jgi:DNA polymerase III subunit chi
MEIFFYHLQQSTLEQALPVLLEKTLQRGWKAVVRASCDERLRALDEHLWSFRDDAFLPHGLEDPATDQQNSIVLTQSDRRINNAEVIFVVDGADLPQTEGWLRVILMFDGNHSEALAKARLAWKSLKNEEKNATYWRQGEQGRWEELG